jgi:hypothetical protein
MSKENIKSKTFEFIEKTQITKKGMETYWFTQEIDHHSAYENKTMVSDSLSFTKSEAETMYNLIIKHNGILEATTVLKSIEVVAK